jgi:integrase/recombinase XerC
MPRSDDRLVRRVRRLPESLSSDEVAMFLADLETHRDRAIVLLMLLGGLRASEVRSLRLADVPRTRPADVGGPVGGPTRRSTTG